MSDTPAATPPPGAGLTFRQNTHNPPLKAGLTPRQHVQQAAFYAHDVRNDPERRDAYGKRIDAILSTPYSVAVADYLNAPNISSVDFSKYHGQVGDTILVMASDDFALYNVRVLIQNADGSTVEEGDAVAEPDGTTFRYVATAHNESLAGDKITITAADYPGNETTKQEVL